MGLIEEECNFVIDANLCLEARVKQLEELTSKTML